MRPAVKELADGVVRSVREFVANAVAPIEQRMGQAENREHQVAARLADLEKRPAPERGEKGDPGEPGRDGRNGEDGKDGAPGERGEKGEPGIAGKDGAPGRDGMDGKDGKDGKDGERGLDGLHGENGVDGKDGKDGLDGKDGAAGRDGRDGKDGRDAADLPIHSGIDAERSYGRGSWAAHAGGLWRAATDTKGMDGWECMVRGFAGPPEVVQLSARDFSIIFKTSDGEAAETVFRMPVVLDMGVWKEDRDEPYAKGDGVTYAGAFWIAQVDGAQERPGTGPQWRLAVKRGRDGKDAGK